MLNLRILFLLFCMLIVHIHAQGQPLTISHEGVLGMTLDVWPLQGFHHEYPIRITWDSTPVKKIEFLIEHPFWRMTPEIRWSDKIEKYATATFLAPDLIAISIEIPGSERSSVIEPGLLADIVFSGKDEAFVKALQYPYYDYEPPIRHSPPLYPILVKDIKITNNDIQIESLPPTTSSVLIPAFILNPVKVTVRDMDDFTCAEPFTLRFLTINDLPFPSFYPTEARLDENGKGEIRAPFLSIGEGKEGLAALHPPTFARFGLYCKDRLIAESHEVYLGWNYEVWEWIMEMEPIQSNNREWLLYR